MARGRELSQLGSLINIEDSTKNIGVAAATPSQKVGIGTNSPTSKVEVVGDVLVSGIITATSFVGDGSGISGLSTFSGSYNDLTDKPTIPTNNNQLTNGAGYITGYTVTQSDVTTHQAALSITESQISDLGTYLTSSDLSSYATQSYVGLATAGLASETYVDSAVSGVSTFSGSYNDLTDKPTIPTNNNQLTNGAGYITGYTVTQSDVTQHQAALSITESQISDLGSYATTSYVDAEVAGLVDSAPGTLDTLNELAAALGDDANFSTTVTNSIATKLPLSGGQMTGNITFSGAQTVDGRDLSVDGSKLDGIESGATADQTASEILTAIKTVDGSGSGLDADLLDGIQASSFAQLSGATFTGVVTATSYYGDGSNLSNIISGVGINSNGVIVGTGITTLNFVGSGVTVVTSGNTADIIVSSPETSPGKSSNSFTATAGQTSFSVSYSVGYIDVYLNGIRLSSDEFTASDGSSVILNTGASSGDVLDVIEYTMGKGGTGDPGPSGPLEVETTSNNDTYNPVFALGTGTTTAFTNSNLSFNPSTGNLSATDFNSTSDINLKENIQRIDNPIEKVLQINGVTFDWKESHQSSAGIIAQEVEAILPEIIKENQGNKSVNYNGLIGLLVEVVKNQQDQINNLTNRVNVLEEGNN